MARLNTRRPTNFESIARAHPPTSDNIIRELCEKIEHGGKRRARIEGRRSVCEEELERFFSSKKEDFDIAKVTKVLTNVYQQLVYHCVDHCEDFGTSTPETFCQRKACVHKSIMGVLARILNNEICFQIVKEKPKIRKRRIEID